jgi:hypothetical protein
MAISRTRSAGAKVTDDEYRQLGMLAQARGLTVGEWCREVLLAQCSEPSTTVPEQTILAEVLGVRMIVINLFRALGKGELSQETLEAVIRRADSEKLPTALERVAQAADPRRKSDR